MTRGLVRSLGFSALLLVFAGCDEVPDETGGGGAGAAGGAGGGDSGTALSVPTSEETTYVDLDQPAVVTATDDWDIAFTGLNVITNGGVSGSGFGASFPVDRAEFSGDSVPADVPFLIDDQFGGPFDDFYYYDGGEHVLYSRYHVFGVRRGGELYKLQVLGFYGDVQGAPVAAIYTVRYAPVTSAGPGATITIADIDGTAGGSMPTDADTSACLRLSTQDLRQLTPAEALADSDWDLCFRRAVISVNGGESGPADVQAVDLNIDESAGETLAIVSARTADTEAPRFDGVGYDDLTAGALAWRGDGVVSGFTEHWVDWASDPLQPNPDIAYLVAGSDGLTPFFVRFDGFDGSTSSSVGTVNLHVKKLSGSLP
ncbi:MAG: HmuY family protein [Polyangiaceae bacterium]